VQETVQQLALCHPHLTWQVQLDTRLWLEILAGKTPRDLLPQFLPRLQVQDLGETVQTELAEMPHTGLHLTLGLPDRAHRHRPDWVKVAINGRFVRSPQLEQTLIASMAHTLPRHRHPIAFLHLHLPPDCVDWHRHPAKTAVYLQYLEQWQAAVRDAIAHILRLNPPDSAVTTSPRLQQLLKTAEPGAAYRLDRAITPAEEPEARRIPLKVVAQVNQTYIVAEHPDGLWLIEQHIAHERILYEQLQAAWEPVALPSPLIVGQLRDRQVQQLQQLGLEIESFGENLWAVRRLPGLLAERDDQVDAIIELSLCPDLTAAQVATACRSAIRNGTPLSLPEMQTLIDQWQQTRNPRTCPHGRPIYLAFDESALAKFFRRHWVIGKSHGI
jgi:DNA mismatch repair protein MutL